MRASLLAAVLTATSLAVPRARGGGGDAPLVGHDFTPEAVALFTIAACGPVPDSVTLPAELLAHCSEVTAVQDMYVDRWVKPARAFFDTHVPKDVPKSVVYPFGDGDLSMALTVFPDADEITAISLAPAGDPRAIATLESAPLRDALSEVKRDLAHLYMGMGYADILKLHARALPTRLIFTLSALKMHGYEVVSLRYFEVKADGTLHYLHDNDLKKTPGPVTDPYTQHGENESEVVDRIFANAELQFRRPGGRIQIYRHIQQNLDDDHLTADQRVLRYLETRGTVAAITQATGYQLASDSFSTMRGYLTKHVAWMVSDTTGIAPKWGRPAGYDYETYGEFAGPVLPAGAGVAQDWQTEFANQPRRALAFRFGYGDKHSAPHLVIMSKQR